MPEVASGKSQVGSGEGRRDDLRWGRSTLALAIGVTLARLAYLALACPYNLIEDEAHYWEWSRRLGLSYYSKGPGIAWAIRACTEVFGTSEFAVRVPAAMAGLVTMLAAAALARDVSGSARVGFYAAAAVVLAPMLQLVGLLSTIDGPFVACWAVACLAAWRAMMRGSAVAWLGLGAAVGVGFLFKYTILLLLPGLVCFAIANRSRLSLCRGWPAMIGACAALVALGLAPVIWWNASQGWPTVHHLLGHLGVAGGDVPIAPVAEGGGRAAVRYVLEPLEFGVSQFGMVGPSLVIALLGVRMAFREADAAGRTGRQFLVACAAPVVLFYVAIAIFKEAEGNWAMGGYVTLLPLAGWVAADAIAEYRRRVRAWLAMPADSDGRRPKQGILRRKPELPAQMLWHAAIAYGIVAGVVMLRLDWVNSAASAAGLRSPIPLGRFMGAPDMAEHTRELAVALRQETGKEPFVVARHYGRASQLAFYLRDASPPLPVLCASSRMEGRRTQYDFWADTSLDQPALLGRPAVLAGDGEEMWRAAFEKVRTVGTLRGDKKRGRPAWVGIGYRGMRE